MKSDWPVSLSIFRKANFPSHLILCRNGQECSCASSSPEPDNWMWPRERVSGGPGMLQVAKETGNKRDQQPRARSSEGRSSTTQQAIGTHSIAQWDRSHCGSRWGFLKWEPSCFGFRASAAAEACTPRQGHTLLEQAAWQGAVWQGSELEGQACIQTPTLSLTTCHLTSYLTQ